MARIRSIKPEFWTSGQILECSRNARLLFIGLWNFSDDKGRHPYRPKQIKAEVYPADDDISTADVEGMLLELSKNNLITKYVVDSVEYLVINGWHHQRIDKAQDPKYPEPPQDNSMNILGIIPPDRIGSDRIGSEGKGKDPIEKPSVAQDAPVNRKSNGDVTQGNGQASKLKTLTDLVTAEWMYQQILVLNPKHKQPNLNKWADEIRLIRERDGRSDEEIRTLFAWANNDPFWRTNILSPATLRKQWDKLVIKKAANGSTFQTPQTDTEIMAACEARGIKTKGKGRMELLAALRA